MKQKKILFLILSMILIIPFFTVLVGCHKKGTTKNKVNATDFFAMAVYSSTNYLSTIGNKSNTKSKFLARTTCASPMTESDRDNLVTYMEMFKPLLTTSNYYTNGANNPNNDDYKDYKFKMDFNEIVDGDQKIVLYYNEINTKTKEEMSENELEEEISSTLQGVAVITTKDGTKIERQVSGIRSYESESEDNKKETEEEISFMMNLDEASLANDELEQPFANYAKMKYSTETERNESEISYEYEIKKENNLIKKAEIEFENESDKAEISIKFQDETAESKEKRKYKIVCTGQNSYNVTFTKKDDVIYTFLIAVERNQTNIIYTFTYDDKHSEDVKVKNVETSLTIEQAENTSNLVQLA